MIPPSEYVSWSEMTGNVVRPIEYDILKSMDRVFCEETNAEIQANRAKREEQLKREAEERNRR